MRVAALAAALAAAVFLPEGAPGIGVVLVALLVALAARLGTGPSLDLWLFGAAALALTSIAALYDAGWLIGIDLAAAILLATVAVAGPRLAAPIEPARALGALPAMTPRPNTAAVPLARGVALVGVVVVPFAVLLISADAAFAALVGDIPLPTATQLPFRGVLFVGILGGALGLGLVRARPPRQLALRLPRALAPIEWILPLSGLVALFLAFVGVQLTVLFGGRDHVLRTTGLTYAQYARSGYWQLLAASVLTLAVIAAAVALADAPLRRHRLILNGLLAALCGLTVVMLVSALHRLGLYENAFGQTRLRLSAEAFAWGLAGFFGLVVAAGVVPVVRRHLARIGLVAAAVGLLAFSLSNPDATIARHNVARWQRTGQLDLSYLQSLSADAAPAIVALPPGLREQALQPLAGRLAPGDRWSSLNLSRRHARNLLGTLSTSR